MIYALLLPCLAFYLSFALAGAVSHYAELSHKAEGARQMYPPARPYATEWPLLTRR
jgi:hypothetical protein